MTVLLTRSTLPQFHGRLARLRPDSARAWGMMASQQMIAHCRRSIEISLGDFPVEDQSNLMMRTVIRFLAFHVLPIPRGKIKAPAIFFPESGGDFMAEKDSLSVALERFVSEAEKRPGDKMLHPTFGSVSL